jgi:ABC-type nitrate/sulfonate/bicarbonate transport system permease component
VTAVAAAMPPSEVSAAWAKYLSIPLLLGVWQAVVQLGLVNPILFPAPTVVAQSLWDYARHGSLWLDLGWSLGRVSIGFAAGAFAGIAIGLATGTSAFVSGMLTPAFQMLRPIPPIAFVPIVIVWFGLTEWGKFFLVFWGVFFTVWLAAHLGVQRVSDTLIRAGACLGASPRRLVWEVQLPASLPVIFVGLRTAIAISFYTLVAAELAGAYAGLAYRLEVVQQNMQIGHMMAGLLMLGLVSTTADRLFGVLQQRVVHWK